MIEEEISTQEEPENVQRGKSAIVWLKIFIIFAFIIGLFKLHAQVIQQIEGLGKPVEHRSQDLFLFWVFDLADRLSDRLVEPFVQSRFAVVQ